MARGGVRSAIGDESIVLTSSGGYSAIRKIRNAPTAGAVAITGTGIR